MEGNQSSNTAKKVFLWCVPRSVSTAVLKCMSNVAGVEAWHEPYAVSHVTTTLYNPTFMPDNVKLNKIRQMLFHPDPKLVELAYSSLPRGRLQDQKLFSYSWVKEQLELNPPEGKNFVFVKDMAFAVRKIHGELPAGYRHTFLIRDPVAVFQSWKRLIATDMYRTEDVESVDINKDAPFFPIHEVFKDTYDLWKYAKEKGEENPVVIDTDDLLNHPDVILPKYFKAIGVEFDEKYITWEKNRKIVEEWRGCFEVTAGGAIGGTYASALDSSCFKPSSRPKIDVSSLSSDLQFCISESLPYYQELYKARLRVD